VAILLEFDATNDVLRGTLEGPMTRAILWDFYATLARYVASHRPCRGIVDFSKVTESDLSSDDVRRMISAPPAFPAGYPRVLVIPKDSLFGLGRMFQILGETTRPELHVVRTMDAAYQLLQIKSPEFAPVQKDDPD
jgi:hypothetical protein